MTPIKIELDAVALREGIPGLDAEEEGVEQ